MIENTENDQLFARARLGISAEQFMHTEIGKAIMDRAVYEQRLAIEELKTVNIFEPNAVKKIQDRALIPDLIIKWLSDIINDGYVAESVINEQDSSHD